MSKRRHKELKSSEHHPHHDSSEVHEPKEHHEKAHEHAVVTKGPKAGFSKTQFYVGFVAVAAVCLVIGFLASSMVGISGVGPNVMTGGDQLIFISPPGCADCDELEPLVMEIANTLNVPFVETGYGQAMETPGLVVVYNGSFMGALAFDSEYMLKNTICMLTQNTEICDEAGELTPPETQTQQPAASNIPKADNVNVKFFTMSYCPYGNQAESGLFPVYDLLGDAVEWEPRFVIYANYGGGGPDYCVADGAYCSMHGIQELNEDIRELCIWKYETHDKYFDFVDDVNTACNSRNVDSCWEDVAKKYGIDTENIKECQASEGVELVSEEYALNQQFGVQGSPTVFINDVQYQGGRAPEDYRAAICSAFNDPPAECGQVLGQATGQASGSC